MNNKLMKAATISRYGRSGVLEITDRPIPAPHADQVVIEVKTASVNPRDWLLMRGLYPFKKFAKPFPITLGSDMSGTVVEVGSNVSSIKVGDDAFGMQPIKGKFGAFAEYAAIKEDAVAQKPSSLKHADVAAIPCAGLTSYQALRDLAKVKKDETVLINGASGGVGSYAVQIAKSMGAYVIAVCGPTNKDLCLSLGADEVINYKDENFEKRPNAYDVVYDVIGRSSFKKCRKSLKKRGRYITTIPSPATALSALLSKVSAIFPFGNKQTAHLILVKPTGTDLAEMAEMMEAGSLKSVIDTEYSLDEITEAFDKAQSWRTRGKLIINIAQ